MYGISTGTSAKSTIPCTIWDIPVQVVSDALLLEIKKERKKGFADFPTYERAYKRAFEKMMQVRRSKGLQTDSWKNGDDVFRWWMNDRNIEGQLSMFDETGKQTKAADHPPR